MPIAGQPNARWSLDFVSDSFGTSRKFRILAVIDDCTGSGQNMGVMRRIFCLRRSADHRELRPL